MSKSQELRGLYDCYCSRFKEFQVVLGEGNYDAKILLIGEAPGKDEVSQGKPFVGMAGKNLSEFLNMINLEREDIFITNTIKYRLSKINPKTGRIINRPTSKQDFDANIGYLAEEIKIINPEYIVTLGNVPLHAVMGNKKISIGEVHGKLNTTDILNKKYKVYPLYHPASIIYNRGLKKIYIEDILNLKAIIEEIIL